MLAAQPAATKNLLAALGGLVKQHLRPGLTPPEWNHITEAALHMAALGRPPSLDDDDTHSASSLDEDYPAPPAQEAAHRAAKARRPLPLARRQGGPSRSKDKLPAPAPAPTKAIHKKKRTPKALRKRRPLTGYNLFFGAVSQRIRDENPDKDFNERGRLAGAEWRQLPSEEKEEWNDKARDVNLRHAEAEEAKAAAISVQEMDEEDEDDEDDEDDEEDD